MLFIARYVWAYRKELTLALAIMETLRRTAREVTRQYLKKKLRAELHRQIFIVGFEIMLLGFAIFIVTEKHSAFNLQLGSAILWGVTMFNLYELLFQTLPELWAVHRILKTKLGYHLRYFLQISIVNELLHQNVVLLIVCLLIAVLSRTLLGVHLSYSALLY